MNSPADTKTKALDIAERRMRESGYQAISFRNLSAELGIRSASLHYHFPSKADLGVELVRRYKKDFESQLDAHRGSDTRQTLYNYVDLYREALGADCRACLCVMLSTEARQLPDEVTDAVRDFVSQHMGWLELWFQDLGMADPRQSAQAALAQLQGGMLLAALNKDQSFFEASAKAVLSLT